MVRTDIRHPLRFFFTAADPHFWTIIFRAAGDHLCVFLRYCGRKTEQYTLTSPPVTASFNVTCSVDKRPLPDGTVQVQLEKFAFGMETKVAAFDVSNLPGNLIEVRMLDVFVMEICEIDPGLSSWRMVGLNGAMDDDMVLFSPTFECGGAHRQLGMMINRTAIPPESIMRVTPDMLFDSAGHHDIADVAFDLLDPKAGQDRINECFDEFEAHSHLSVMPFPPELSSGGRKYVHSVASVKGMQHTTHTIDGMRQVWCYKSTSSAQGDGPIDVCVKTVGSSWPGALALRVELQSEHFQQSRAVGHHYITGPGSRQVTGCAGLLRRCELHRGDRSEVVSVKLTTCDEPEDRGPLYEHEIALAGVGEKLTSFQSAFAYQQLQASSGRGKFLHAKRAGLVGRPAPATDSVLNLLAAEAMVRHEVPVGTRLCCKSDIVQQYILVASGTCHAENLGVTKQLETLPAICDLDEFLFGMQTVHTESVIATSPCELYVLTREALLAVRSMATPPEFPPASFHSVGLDLGQSGDGDQTRIHNTRLRKAVAAGISSGIGEKTNGVAARYIWRLRHPSLLLAAPMDRWTIASQWFAVPSTPGTRWRLLLIPHNFFNGKDASGEVDTVQRYTLAVGCSGYLALRSGQLSNGSFRLHCSLAATGKGMRS
eukprot:SAG22_NODE_1516_length_4248_cov_83.377042_4_plen_654_part_00